MATITVTYTWSIPDTFDINYNWKVVPAIVEVNFPTLISNGPQNSLSRPTLLYPNGGDNILAREIEISWLENFPASADGLRASFEVFFCENYDYLTEPDWKMIAVVPSGIGKFNWRIGNTLKSKNVRCGVRAVNSRGERSAMSISATSFAIQKSIPNTPVVLSPLPNSRYGNSISFVFDDSGIINTFSQRAKYSAYISSAKASVPFTPIFQNIPVGTGPLMWDTTSMPAADDYLITVFLADDDSNKSQEVNITDVQILHDNFFVIDTQPPTGFVQINNANQYTKSTDVSVKLFAFDETTGIHSMQFVESAAQEILGSPDYYTNMKFWTLSDKDGEKLLKVKLQDYGGNRASESTKLFRILFDLNNADIADMILQSTTDVVWMAVNGNAPGIYKFTPQSSLVANLSEEVNSLCFYDNVLYISIKTSDNTALMQRWTGFVIEEVFALTVMDSEIITMAEYKGKLYCGSKNGNLSVYDKTSVTNIRNLSGSINKLYSDGNLLYIVTSGSKNVQIFDGNQYTEVST